jgi:hypothetical protein
MKSASRVHVRLPCLITPFSVIMQAVGRDYMTVDTIIGLAGLAATIIFGIVGARYIIKKRSMKQSATKESVAIQSGRDTKIND